MLTRVQVVFVLLFSLCIKDIWTQQNNASHASGNQKSTTPSALTKRNVIQNNVNQVSSNPGMQIDLQQRLNAWRAANLHAQKSSQMYNLQVPNLHQTTANTQNNLPNSISPSMNQALHDVQTSLPHSPEAQNSQHAQSIPGDYNSIKKETIVDPQLQNVAATDPAKLQAVLQLLQASLQQQQSQNLQNVQNVQVPSQQVSHQISNVPQPAELQHLSVQQPQVTTTQDRSVNSKQNTETNSFANLYSSSISREIPVEQLQNPHYLMPSSPAQVIDQSQLLNLLQYSPHMKNTLDSVQNMPHQISTVSPIQYSTGFQSSPHTYGQNQIYPNYSTTLASNSSPMTNMYEAQGVSRIGSSDSHMRAILPIIYSLLREPNDCGCCSHRCECSQMKRNQQQRQELDIRSNDKSKDKHVTRKHKKVNTNEVKESNAIETKFNNNVNSDKQLKTDKSYEDYYSEEDCYDDESNYID